MKSGLATVGLFMATLFWGASFFLVKNATAMVGVWPFISYRFILATVLMIVVFPKKFWQPSKTLFFRGCLLGFVLFLALVTQTIGLQTTSASHSGFLTALYVPLTPLIGWVLLKHKIYFRQILTTLLSLLGLYILTNPKGALKGWWAAISPGDIWTILTAFSYAAHIVITERFSRQEPDSLALGLWQFVWCTLWILVGLAVVSHSSPENEAHWIVWKWPGFALFSLIFNGVLTTCFGFIMQIIAQKTMGSLKAALIFALEAPFASVFAFLFAGEFLTGRELTGAAIVFLASIIPEGWLKTS